MDANWKRDLDELKPYFVEDYAASFDIGPGWLQIVLGLHREMVQIRPEYKIVQIKEKFGGLRYYYEPFDKRLEDLVRAAERQAWETCSECGHEGSTDSGRGFMVLCDSCKEKRS